jgi:hypothetical protein
MSISDSTKLEVFRGAMLLAIGIADTVFIHWVGNVNWWVAWMIASAMTFAIDLSSKVRDNRRLFDLNDRELVRVSALANHLEERLIEIQNELDEVKLHTHHQ